MKSLIILALLGVRTDTLDLEWCYQQAAREYPLFNEIALQSRIAEERTGALSANFLPHLSFRADASYQSEVPDFASFPGGFSPPAISHDQYHFTLGAEQLLYDGGRTRKQKDLVAAEAAEARQRVEVDLYALHERINASYFGALLLQAKAASLETLREDLEARHALVSAQVDQGVTLQSNADVIQVELINIEQQLLETDKQRLAALDVLGRLVGAEIASTTVLSLPNLQDPDRPANDRRRPEYGLFATSRSSLDREIALTGRTNHPTLAAFGDASYGRYPGTNFFETDFSPYYAVGVKLSWKLWDWSASRRRQQALRIRQDIVDVREETFTRNLEISLARQTHEIERLEEMLQRHEEIIDLRNRIVEQAESQLENGVITSTEYLIERNAAFRAELTRNQHRIELSQTRAEILTTVGEAQ